MSRSVRIGNLVRGHNPGAHRRVGVLALCEAPLPTVPQVPCRYVIHACVAKDVVHGLGFRRIPCIVGRSRRQAPPPSPAYFCYSCASCTIASSGPTIEVDGLMNMTGCDGIILLCFHRAARFRNVLGIVQSDTDHTLGRLQQRRSEQLRLTEGMGRGRGVKSALAEQSLGQFQCAGALLNEWKACPEGRFLLPRQRDRANQQQFRRRSLPDGADSTFRS